MQNIPRADCRIYRYVITDYDAKNFTVAQATFNEKSEPKLVPIPWNATVAPTARNGLNRKATIGISTGSVAFALLLIIAIICCILRKRNYRAVEPSKDAVMPVLESSETRPFSIQEMGPEIVRELHATSHHIELLDKQAPSGSGMDIQELSDWKKSSTHESFPTTIKNQSTPTPREKDVSSTNIKKGEDEPSTDLVIRTFNISILSLNLDPHRPTPMRNDTMENGINIIRARRNPSKVSMKNNVTKALPQVPPAERPSSQNRSSYRSHQTNPMSETIQMLSVSHLSTRGLPAHELDSVAVDPRMSPTYATVFNTEAYQDSVIASPTLSPTGSLSKPT